MKVKYILGTMCVAALMSSCRIYKSYKRPDNISTEGVYREVMAEDTTNFGNLAWREVFTDSKLQTLIEEGLANNVDMRAAVLRIDAAKARLTSSKLAFLPSIALAPQGSITKMENLPSARAYTLPATASWEVDLFGKLLNAAKGQNASFLNSVYTAQATRSQLIGGIANAYYTLMALDRQVEITTQTVDIWKENVRIMEAMKQAGMTTEAAVTQNRAAYNQVAASLIDLQRQVREAENSLSTLIGRPAQSIDRNTLAAQSLPTQFSAGVPMQLLSNRPDVKIAEMSLASAYYSTNQARAAFYPGLNITGTLGWTNGSGISVSNPGQFMMQALASLTQPIFSNGRLVANLKATKVEEEVARMNFQQKILEAGAEVSNALYLYDAQSRKIVEDQARVAELEKAVTYTQELFRSASATYLEILSAQQSLLNAQITEVSDQLTRMQSVVTLYSALGGGRE